MESYIEYEDVVLEGKAAAKNLYKGMPTPEINARWEELYKGIIFFYYHDGGTLNAYGK